MKAASTVFRRDQSSRNQCRSPIRRCGWRAASLIASGEQERWAWVFLVDTGFAENVGTRRGRKFLRCPIDSLKLLDIDPESVTDCIITHLHYDHVGNFSKLPRARFHIQEREMAFATGRFVRYGYFGHGFEEEDVVGMVRLNFKRRLEM